MVSELRSIFEMHEENCGCAFSRISGVNHTLPAKYIWPETMDAVTPAPPPPHPSQGEWV